MQTHPFQKIHLQCKKIEEMFPNVFNGIKLYHYLYFVPSSYFELEPVDMLKGDWYFNEKSNFTEVIKAHIRKSLLDEIGNKVRDEFWLNKT